MAGVLYEYIFDPSRHMRLVSDGSEDSECGGEYSGSTEGVLREYSGGTEG